MNLEKWLDKLERESKAQAFIKRRLKFHYTLAAQK